MTQVPENLGWRGPLPPDWRARLGWVYIIEHAGLYKVGSAKDLERRIRQLRTAAPMLRVVQRIPSLSYRELEKLIHNLFCKERRVGEWFDLTEANLKFLAKCDGEGRILFSKGVSYLYAQSFRRRSWRHAPVASTCAYCTHGAGEFTAVRGSGGASVCFTCAAGELKQGAEIYEDSPVGPKRVSVYLEELIKGSFKNSSLVHKAERDEDDDE